MVNITPVTANAAQALPTNWQIANNIKKNGIRWPNKVILIIRINYSLKGFYPSMLVRLFEKTIKSPTYFKEGTRS